MVGIYIAYRWVLLRETGWTLLRERGVDTFPENRAGVHAFAKKNGVDTFTGTRGGHFSRKERWSIIYGNEV